METLKFIGKCILFILAFLGGIQIKILIAKYMYGYDPDAYKSRRKNRDY